MKGERMINDIEERKRVVEEILSFMEWGIYPQIIITESKSGWFPRKGHRGPIDEVLNNKHINIHISYCLTE